MLPVSTDKLTVDPYIDIAVAPAAPRYDDALHDAVLNIFEQEAFDIKAIYNRCFFADFYQKFFDILLIPIISRLSYV